MIKASPTLQVLSGKFWSRSDKEWEWSPTSWYLFKPHQLDRCHHFDTNQWLCYNSVMGYLYGRTIASSVILQWIHLMFIGNVSHTRARLFLWDQFGGSFLVISSAPLWHLTGGPFGSITFMCLRGCFCGIIWWEFSWSSQMSYYDTFLVIPSAILWHRKSILPCGPITLLWTSRMRKIIACWWQNLGLGFCRLVTMMMTVWWQRG